MQGKLFSRIKQAELLIVFGFMLIYATLRYIIFGKYNWPDLPVFVINKAVSVTMLYSLGVSIIGSSVNVRRKYGHWAILLVVLHVILSVIGLATGYFTKFIGDGHLTIWASVSLLAGALGATLLVAKQLGFLLTEPSVIFSKIRVRWVLWLSAIHLSAMGWQGWLTPTSWPGYLPPITLISVLIIFVFEIIYIFFRRK